MGKKPSSDLRVTSAPALIVLAVVVGVTVFLIVDMWLRSGRPPVAVPAIVVCIPLAIALFVGWQAWQVRQHRLGKRGMDPLQAARIWVLTQAGSRAGALLVGLSLGVGFAYWHSGSATFLREQSTVVFVAAGASLVLTVISMIGERWCKNDDDPAPASPA